MSNSINTRTPNSVCKSHAYLRVPLKVHLQKRFGENAPIRMAILPFSAQENLAGYPNYPYSLGERVSALLQRELLSRQVVPIVEIFNRSDWPGKREEFFQGNFAALERAAHAGYDLLLVGVLDDMNRLDSITASAKLIEVATGITLWNSQVTSSLRSLSWLERAQLGRTDPARETAHYPELTESLVMCMRDDMLEDYASYWEY